MYVLGVTVGIISVGLLLGGCPAQSTSDTIGNNTGIGSQSGDNVLVGTWDFVQEVDGEWVKISSAVPGANDELIEFHADGTGMWGAFAFPPASAGMLFDYEIVGSSSVKLTMTPGTVQYGFTVNGDRLTLTGVSLVPITGQKRAD